MKTITQSSMAIFLICAFFAVSPNTGSADETFHMSTILQTATFRWDNTNWFTETHPKIATFSVREDGSSYGTTETGVQFTQENVENMLNIRIQKFVMEDHSHYIIDGEIVYTFEELSIRLAKAHLATTEYTS